MRRSSVIGLGTLLVVTTLPFACGEPAGHGGSVGSGAGSATLPSGRATTPPSTSGRETGCAEGRYEVVARVNEAPPPICLRLGATLAITAVATTAQPWQPFASSAPDVLDCVSNDPVGDTTTALCRPHRAGTASVSTMTAAFAGDPHGPPQHTWRLSVQVVG